MFATRRATRTVLYWSAVVYTALGLVGGVYYRELTRAHAFTGKTQLSVLHTHLLALGLLLTLVLIALEQVFHLSADARFPVFYWAWTAGMTVTLVLMTIKGTLQVTTPMAATNPALAGIAGMGHILLTIALVVLLMVLRARLAVADD